MSFRRLDPGPRSGFAQKGKRGCIRTGRKTKHPKWMPFLICQNQANLARLKNRGFIVSFGKFQGVAA